MVLTGLRGVGKTVLLNEFGRLAEGHGYLHEPVELSDGDAIARVIARLARTALYRLSATRRTADRARRALGVLKAFTVSLPDGASISLDLDPIHGPADSGDLGRDLGAVFRELGETGRAHGAGILFTFDEMQYLREPELSALIVGLHRMHQLNLPFVVAGAGLPSMPGLAGEARSYAERLFSFPIIGSLDEQAAVAAIVDPAKEEGVAWDRAAVDRILELSLCYPYFIQEFAKQSWDAAAGSPIGLDDVMAAEPAAHSELDGSFFRTRFDRISDGERAYLRAMADLGVGPHQSGAVAARLGRRTNQIGPTRERLIRRGLVYSPRYGEVTFTVPLFDQFLRRVLGRGPQPPSTSAGRAKKRDLGHTS